MSFLSKTRIKNFFALLIVGAVGAVLFSLIWESRAVILVQVRHASLSWLVFATLLLVAHFFSHPWIYFVLLKNAGQRASFADLAGIYFQARAGRYIPGKLWSVAGLVVLGKGKGIDPFVMGIVAVSGTLMNLAAAGVHSLLLAGSFLSGSGRQGGAVAAAIVASFVFIWLLQTVPVQGRLWRLAGRARAGGTPAAACSISFAAHGRAFAICWLGWILYGLAGTALLRAFVPVAPEDLALLNSMFAFSYLAGYLALLVPGGIGVQEGIITWILGGILGQGIAAAMAVVLRIWMSVVEFILIGAAFWQGRTSAREKNA